jgi:hypothetical protein
MQTRVLFARIGWMTYYAGIQPDDPRPIGGGAYNKKDRGSELFNFKRIKDLDNKEVLYGFVSPPAIGKNRLNLERIDPACVGDELDKVTVIFVSDQKIIGWYRNATLLRDWRDDPTGERVWTEKRKGQQHSALYNMKTRVRDAVLLPKSLRDYEIPSGKNGIGQANVRYTYDFSCKLDLRPWMRKAIEHVRDHYANNSPDDNLLTNPAANEGAAVAEALEKAAGYQSDPAIRKVVEDHAMKLVEADYRRSRFSVENTSKIKSYDFLCKKENRERYVEVKGTQTSDQIVSLTYNEVKIARDAGIVVDLCVVHSIKVIGSKKPRAEGGILIKYPNWQPREHELREVQFTCRLNPKNALK